MSKVQPGPCDEYVIEFSRELDKLQLNELNCSKPEDIIDTVISKYLSSRWFKRAAWHAIPSKDKYIKKVKILFWKLKGDHAFLAACRENNIIDIKDKFKDTIKEATGYLSFCVGKQYTYKHLNSNIKRFNNGVDPVLIPIEQPLSNRNARALSRNENNSVGEPTSLQTSNSSSEANAKTIRNNKRTDNAIAKIKTFLLRKTKTIKNNKKKSIIKSFLLGTLRKRRTQRQNNNSYEKSINFKGIPSINNNNNEHEMSINFKGIPSINNNNNANSYVTAKSNNNNANSYITARSNNNNANSYITARSNNED